MLFSRESVDINWGDGYISQIEEVKMAIRVRFAPSPTGMPHVGVIRTAIFDWLLARHFGGQFILRIEDTDRTRFVEGAVENIIEALEWLGIDIDEGPAPIGGQYGPYFQSQRLDLYYRYADYLLEKGFAYWCDCSPERLEQIREEQALRKDSIGYDSHCREKNLSGTPGDGVHVLRFKIPKSGTTTFRDELRGDITVQNADLDDLVLLKRDGFPTYHFASVIDDHHMAISHVFRGEEWISSAPKHKLLYDALKIDPPAFVHVPVILGPDKKKLSKRHGAANVLEYREMGYLPEALVNFLALIGWNPGDDEEIFSHEKLIERFSLDRINASPGVFDIEKLDWMNGEYIRRMSVDELAEKLAPLMVVWGWIDTDFRPWGKDYVRSTVELMQERLKKLPEMRIGGGFFFEEPSIFNPDDVKKSFKGDDIIERLNIAKNSLTDCEWTHDGIETAIRDSAEKLGCGAGKIIHPVRLAVSGMTGGPSLFEMLDLIGRDRVLKRIEFAIAWLNSQT
jgi:glutamyl-tRNA synthetase